MPEIAGPGSKRKRVATACQTCRDMKSKCDGARPTCSKCEGYGYRCNYPASRRGKTRPVESPQSCQSPVTAAPLDNLSGALAEYKALAQELVEDIPEDKRAVAARRLVAATNGVEAGFLNLRAAVQLSGVAPRNHPSTDRTASHSERYLGEVSDVQFFNLIKRSLRDNTLTGRGAEEALESYELDDHPETALDHSVELPSREISKGYLEIYFSTIHLAYPFLQKPIFTRTHEQLRDSSSTETPSDLWLAHLYVIFAIGSYYNSFPRKDGAASTHAGYFQRALVLGTREILERSVDQVSFLLIQCFYLLAVCRTDRCWTTLGLAIRVAQSIGLHVEGSGGSMSLRHHAGPKAESRRRLWYSLFVLDRLVSLQLGRPPAIHDDDFNVALPSRLEDTVIDWDSDGPLPLSIDGPSGGDYFLGIISLSHIISCVLRELYSPRRSLDLAAILHCTKQLDKQLLAWKNDLPRTLRFDFGHAFETSHTFRRQRNMLAIKFYHLRALIHRPAFYLSLLHPHEIWGSLSAAERLTLSRYENICVSSAQETAHLLHNVSSEQELVHDFPWWQMISCLICASSILLVSSLFASPLPREEEQSTNDFSVATLNADAETCLKIFEALSVNSDAARLAKDMMTKLKERAQEWKEARTAQAAMEPPMQAPPQHTGSDLGPALQPHYEDDVSIFTHLDLLPGAAQGTVLEEWPAEILDSMAWSAHFLEAVNTDRQMESHLI